MAIGRPRVQVRERRARKAEAEPGVVPSPARVKKDWPAVVFFERPDPDGRRWQAAVGILLEAGARNMRRAKGL